MDGSVLVKLQKNKTKQRMREMITIFGNQQVIRMIDILACEDMARFETERKKTYTPTNRVGYERDRFSPEGTGEVLKFCFVLLCFALLCFA